MFTSLYQAIFNSPHCKQAHSYCCYKPIFQVRPFCCTLDFIFLKIWTLLNSSKIKLLWRVLLIPRCFSWFHQECLHLTKNNNTQSNTQTWTDLLQFLQWGNKIGHQPKPSSRSRINVFTFVRVIWNSLTKIFHLAMGTNLLSHLIGRFNIHFFH